MSVGGSIEISSIAIAKLAELTAKSIWPFSDLFSGDKKLSVREEQMLLLKNLSEAEIDPHLFDLLLSNELDRNLKKQFGIAFLVATVFFCLLSYGIVIANSVYKWGISEIAIAALIIETPIQFIGLLYIIARNLFPQSPIREIKISKQAGQALPAPAAASKPRKRRTAAVGNGASAEEPGARPS